MGSLSFLKEHEGISQPKGRGELAGQKAQPEQRAGEQTCQVWRKQAGSGEPGTFGCLEEGEQEAGRVGTGSPSIFNATPEDWGLGGRHWGAIEGIRRAG